MGEIHFERLAGKTYLCRGSANVGLYDLGGGKAALIDSGADEDAGRKLLRAAGAAGFEVSLIVNTHSNADHCGGNAFIQSRTGCRIAAARIEAAFIEDPILEPSLLWGGRPPAQLRHKFLMAKPSRVTERLDPPCSINGAAGAAMGDTGLRALPLPGHFLGMIGVLTPDRVFFAADALASREILEKYHVFFFYDLDAALATLEGLGSIEADWFVPSHAEPTEDREALAALASAHREKIGELADFLVTACGSGATTEELLSALASGYGIELNHSQYVLVGSTLRSYLSWLEDSGRLESRFEGKRLLYSPAPRGS